MKYMMIRISGNFMVSFDAESLFTNKPLDECIELAVKYISEGTAELRSLFRFATAHTWTINYFIWMS